MNKYNNYSTLEHYKGRIWLTKMDNKKRQKELNICQETKGDFQVLYYVIKTEKGFTFNHNKYYSLDNIVYESLKAIGALWMLEDLATCQHCGKTYEETKINMIDYELDICIDCEKGIVS